MGPHRYRIYDRFTDFLIFAHLFCFLFSTVIKYYFYNTTSIILKSIFILIRAFWITIKIPPMGVSGKIQHTQITKPPGEVQDPRAALEGAIIARETAPCDAQRNQQPNSVLLPLAACKDVSPGTRSRKERLENECRGANGR